MDAIATIDDGVEVENFGLNIQVCATLLGHDLQWLAGQTGINHSILEGYTDGEGVLPCERIRVIAGKLGLAEDSSVLKCDASDDEDRRDRMHLALMSAGMLSADGDVPEDSEAKPPDAGGSDDAPGVPESVATGGETGASEPSRSDIARNIRAAVAKSARKLLETLAEAGVCDISNKRVLSSYENGSVDISADQLAQIAQLTDVTVDQLHTGEGLEEFFPKPKGPKGSQASLPVEGLPVVTEAELREYFRSRVLNREVKPAQGVEFGELMELALDPDTVDYRTAWLEKTADGQAFLQTVEAHAEQLKPYGRVAKFYHLSLLIERLFDD